LDGILVIPIIFLKKKILYVGVIKKVKNFCYIIVVVQKYKYDLLSLLHLKVTNIYTSNFNLYQKIYIIVCNFHAKFI